MSNQLICSFNSYSFNHTAQTLITYLNDQEIQQLITAITNQPQLQNLKNIAISRLYVSLLNKFDRTIYYNIYDNLPGYNIMERQSKLMCDQEGNSLQALLGKYKRIMLQGKNKFGDSFQIIQEAIKAPPMALPPVKRTTVAPSCKTVYQVMLACKKLNLPHYDTDNCLQLNIEQHQANAYIHQLLSVYIQMTNHYMTSIQDEIQHFTELTLRFLVYKDTVLSLYETFPFIQLEQLVSLWSVNMRQHYHRANKVCLCLLGIQPEKDRSYGFLTIQEISQEGFLIDYIQGLVDQSVNEDVVSFCGHSKQTLNYQYTLLENTIIDQLNLHCLGQQSDRHIQNTFNTWIQQGLKPTTVRRICEHLSSLEDLKDKYFNSVDQHIQNCGRIHGLLDEWNYLQCF